MMRATTLPTRRVPGQTRDGFYRDVLRHLNAMGVPYLVGGTYGFARITGLMTPTKDLDLFLRRQDCDRVCASLVAQGYDAALRYPHWLAKVRHERHVIDLIFNSGNGLSPVDDEWMQHGIPARVLGVEVRLCPVEEMIWTKAFVMERERYDGSDVAHLIRARAEHIDWPRLVRRFGAHVPMLVCHLILFRFIYPGERHRLPHGVFEELLQRVRDDAAADGHARLCRGGLLSRAQYLVDLEDWGYDDARREPHGRISADEMAKWNAAVKERPHRASDDECE
jgi:hypothetical protein